MVGSNTRAIIYMAFVVLVINVLIALKSIAIHVIDPSAGPADFALQMVLVVMIFFTCLM